MPRREKHFARLAERRAPREDGAAPCAGHILEHSGRRIAHHIILPHEARSISAYAYRKRRRGIRFRRRLEESAIYRAFLADISAPHRNRADEAVITRRSPGAVAASDGANIEDTSPPSGRPHGAGMRASARRQMSAALFPRNE